MGARYQSEVEGVAETAMPVLLACLITFLFDLLLDDYGLVYFSPLR